MNLPQALREWHVEKRRRDLEGALLEDTQVFSAGYDYGFQAGWDAAKMDQERAMRDIDDIISLLPKERQDKINARAARHLDPKVGHEASAE